VILPLDGFGPWAILSDRRAGRWPASRSSDQLFMALGHQRQLCRHKQVFKFEQLT
jgi:hypothetical protein